MPSRRNRKAKTGGGSPTLQRWIAHGFTRGCITLPNGPLDLGDGWSLHPDNDAARSAQPFLILASPNTMARVGNPHEWPSLRLMGTVEAPTREEALRIAESEMDALVGLLTWATTGAFDTITGISVALAESGRDAELRADATSAPAVPITEDEIENMTRLCTWWRSLQAGSARDAVRRSLAWYRYATWLSQHSLRAFLLWASAEAMSQAFPAPKTPRECEHCHRPLVCATCSETSYRTEPYITVNDLLVKRYGVMSKNEFSEFGRGRSGPAHGGRAPKDRQVATTPWLISLHSALVQALRDLATGTNKPIR